MKHTRSYIAFAIAGIIVGGVLPALLYGVPSRSMVNGMIMGVAIGVTLAYVELSVLASRLRRIPFLRALVIRTAIQIGVIVFYAVFFEIGLRMLSQGLSLSAAYHQPSTQQFLFGGDLLFIVIYALTAAFLINMIRQMSRMLGQDVLVNIVLGRYARPVEEERIFMFLDLDGSTRLAEQLGNIRFHELIDDYIFDITPAIAESKGEIYQYVGDEIVVTWKLDSHHMATGRCVDCFFRICTIMNEHAPKYLAKYGSVPGFKAGLHCGTVIAGQIGDIKQEIVFQGDVVNTASRIKEKCHSLGAIVLLSRELLDRLPMDTLPYKADRVGSFLLKGKEHEVELYSVAKR